MVWCPMSARVLFAFEITLISPSFVISFNARVSKSLLRHWARVWTARPALLALSDLRSCIYTEQVSESLRNWVTYLDIEHARQLVYLLDVQMDVHLDELAGADLVEQEGHRLDSLAGFRSLFPVGCYRTQHQF